MYRIDVSMRNRMFATSVKAFEDKLSVIVIPEPSVKICKLNQSFVMKNLLMEGLIILIYCNCFVFRFINWGVSVMFNPSNEMLLLESGKIYIS